MRRKAIPWKTKYASALLALCHVPYDDAKQMTEDQIISLYQLDHYPHLHETGHPDRDKFWNLTPMFIGAHREKTRKDAKIIAKSRRIRKGLDQAAHSIDQAVSNSAGAGNHVARLRPAPLRTDPDGASGANCRRPSIRSSSGLLRSRGFDKTKTKGFDGKVRERRKHGRSPPET